LYRQRGRKATTCRQTEQFRRLIFAALPPHSAVSLRLTVQAFSFLLHPEAEPQDEEIKRILGSERRSLSALCGGGAAEEKLSFSRKAQPFRTSGGGAEANQVCVDRE